MQDFGKFVYLDMPKTGSTLTSDFLQKCCILPEVSFDKHKPMDRPKQDGVFYFSTVRDPKDLYESLFQFGCSHRGGLFKKIRDLGQAELYQPNTEHFRLWMQFMMDPKFLTKCYPRMRRYFKMGFGFQSTRYIYLNLAMPRKAIVTCGSMQDVIRVFGESNISDLIIRNENLNEGLKEFATVRFPQYFDQVKVADYFAGNIKLNTSVSPLKSLLERAWTDEMLAEFRRKEAVLIELYGREDNWNMPPDAAAMGAPHQVAGALAAG